MTSHRPRSRRLARAFLLGPAVLLLAVLLPASPASAHPLDAYLQSTYLTLSPSAVSVEIDLSPGVLIAPRILDTLDSNHDQAVSAAEGRAYLARVVQDAELRVDGVPLALTLATVQVPPYLTIRAGYGTLRAFATAPILASASAISGEHQAFFRNGFADSKAAYQVNAFVAKNAPLALGAQRRAADQRQATVTYQVGPAGAPVPVSVPASVPKKRSEVAGFALARYLEAASLSWWMVLAALGAAALLGALHALTPGHAKTLIAAYLVGSDGTAANAVTLGAVVTFTHTASVILIGLVALLASQFLVPGILVPALELGSGILVLALGLRLLRRRWRARTGAPSPALARELVVSGVAHQHGHDSGHGHPHEHGHGHPHEHGGQAHTHELPPEGISVRSLVAMGVSGGLVPCPEALGVMVLAVGVNRTVLGLGLIVSFSLGLAAVLIGLGLLLVRSRSLVARFAQAGTRWTTLLPLVSAVVVTVLGAGLLLKGLAPILA